MAHLQYMPGDPRLVDQLVYELKSKGIFDQFRKECIADVDTRPAYQNLRQRVESSVASFLSRQCWKPDLNKNQLREKLRKHLLDGNYLEQGVERIVDQVVNPKVASVFIPQVEDVVYNYLGIPRKKAVATETSNGKTDNDLLPTDLEAVSPGSVKSNDDKNDAMDTTDVKDDKMDVDEPKDVKEDQGIETDDKEKVEESSSIIEIISPESESIDKSTIPLPTEEIKLENIPAPENSPPNIKNKKIDLEKIDLPKEPNLSTDIPLPDEMPKIEAGTYFKPITLQSEDDDSSSDSSLRRNMSPLTPIRNFNNENSCDAQQAFENDSDSKSDDKKEPSTFRFTIESKSSDNSSDKPEMKPPSPEQQNLSYQFNQVNINTFNTPLYDDSSNSHNLQIDYESDVNSKMTVDTKLPEAENSTDSKKEKKDDKKSHKSSHRSRDSHRHSSSKDKGSESKHSSSRDSSRHDKKPKDDKSKSSKEKSSEKDRKDSRDSSKHRSSHKSSSHKDSKSHRSSSSSKHSSRTDDKKSSSKDKDKSSDKSSKDRSSSKSSSHRSDKDRKSSKSKSDEKENKEKKEKKETDDHYSLSGRGNPNRRSTDRDSNDGSSSSKGSQHPSSTKSSESKKENKSSSKSENTSTSDSTSPSDNNVVVNEAKTVTQVKPVVRVDTHLETPFSSPPRLPFVPDVTLKKPRFAANMEEAKRMIKMRKFLEEEQKRMNQEAALLLEFQANVRPSLSQVYSSIPGPELEFACVSNVDPTTEDKQIKNQVETNTIKDVVKIEENMVENKVKSEEPNDLIAQTLIAMHQGDIVKDNDGNAQENVDSEIKENINVNEDKESLIHTLVNNDNENSVEEDKKFEIVEEVTQSQNEKTDPEVVLQDEKKKDFEITIITEEILETEEMKHEIDNPEKIIFEEVNQECPEENLFKYFAEHEKYNAELERDQFDNFLKTYTEKTLQKKLYLINCDSYEENVIREASHNFGNFEIVNYYKNGHLKLSTANKNIVKDVNVTTEITLPTKTVDYVNSVNTSPVFSPVKSECSFELSSDYDAKLEEMVNKTSRQEIMEIILGNVDESPSKMPRIDYCTDSNIDHETNVEINAEMETENVLKRKLFEMEGTVNNNRNILTANKIRKLSGSDQISSTTEETEDNPNNNRVNNTRSKYLGKARRVGLPRPKKTTLPNSPSSDKSVENYEQNAETSLNGKIKRTVQRYDTSDLYKPKLHYLSRRNNIS